jgi:hypothetical protein
MNGAIGIANNEVKINGTCFLNHDYQFTRIPVLIDQLSTISRQIAISKLILFFPDALPVTFCNIDHLIDLIVVETRLTHDLIEVQTSSPNYKNSQIRVVYLPSNSFDLVCPWLENRPQYQLDADARLFGAVYGRYTLERFLMAYYVDTQFKDNSFVVFQPHPDVVRYEFTDFEDSYKKELEWVRNFANKNKTVETLHYNGISDWTKGMQTYPTIWPKFKIEIIAETDSHNSYWFTDKTIKCLYTKKPFLVVAGQGMLAYLRELGFKTFHPYIDESYDSEPSLGYRLESIKQELNRIHRLNPDQLTELLDNLAPIMQYNQDIFESVVNNYGSIFHTMFNDDRNTN